MTKYILNSGGLRRYPEKLALFHREILKGLGDNPKILFCMFARKREDWEEKFKEYKDGFSNSIDKNIKPVIELAMPEKFEEQVKESDVIILFGGDDYLIQYWLKQYDLPKIWEGKVVAGSSAGSNVLAEHFWTSDWKKCMNGFGILPIKFIAHYKSEYSHDDPKGAVNWDEVYTSLAEYGDKSLFIEALEEGDFIIIDK